MPIASAERISRPYPASPNTTSARLRSPDNGYDRRDMGEPTPPILPGDLPPTQGYTDAERKTRRKRSTILTVVIVVGVLFLIATGNDWWGWF